jgi:hypothetical protein
MNTNKFHSTILPRVTKHFVALGTDMAPAISLAYENPESNIMNRKP